MVFDPKFQLLCMHESSYPTHLAIRFLNDIKQNFETCYTELQRQELQ